MTNILKKEYDISLVWGNTSKTILEMDEVDICYGLNILDKNEILLYLIKGIKKDYIKFS